MVDIFSVPSTHALIASFLWPCLRVLFFLDFSAIPQVGMSGLQYCLLFVSSVLPRFAISLPLIPNVCSSLFLRFSCWSFASFHIPSRYVPSFESQHIFSHRLILLSS